MDTIQFELGGGISLTLPARTVAQRLIENLQEQPTPKTFPKLGEYLPSQGGIYVGQRLIDGQTHHIIMSGGVGHDIKASYNNAAERIAAKGEINGFSDWRHGSQEDLMLAYINAREHFHRKGEESLQVTSTPYGSSFAWVVGFEGGSVDFSRRCHEFLVRPFRSFIA